MQHSPSATWLAWHAGFLSATHYDAVKLTALAGLHDQVSSRSIAATRLQEVLVLGVRHLALRDVPRLLKRVLEIHILHSHHCWNQTTGITLTLSSTPHGQQASRKLLQGFSSAGGWRAAEAVATAQAARG
jgi:hypothetical protein